MYCKCIIICVRSYQVRDPKRSITRSKGVFVLFHILNNFIIFPEQYVCGVFINGKSFWCTILQLQGHSSSQRSVTLSSVLLSEITSGFHTWRVFEKKRGFNREVLSSWFARLTMTLTLLLLGLSQTTLCIIICTADDILTCYSRKITVNNEMNNSWLSFYWFIVTVGSLSHCHDLVGLVHCTRLKHVQWQIKLQDIWIFFKL